MVFELELVETIPKGYPLAKAEVAPNIIPPINILMINIFVFPIIPSFSEI